MTVWKPDNVNLEPTTYLTNWKVFEVNGPNLKSTRHLVGYAAMGLGGEGRVSSPIIEYDRSASVAITRSGRKYKLGEVAIGLDQDSNYVWTNFQALNKIESTVDVTKEYL